MSEPAILIPSGLSVVHPQLETSIKSIAAAIRSLQRRAGSPVAGNSGAMDSGMAALQAQVQALQAEVSAIPRGRGFAFFC